jgi:hypothetical protein
MMLQTVNGPRLPPSLPSQALRMLLFLYKRDPTRTTIATIEDITTVSLNFDHSP